MGDLGKLRDLRRGPTVDKWIAFSHSKVLRITASATTLVAIAAIVGAGWKWY
jgi:hypothetical protein